MLYKLSSGAHQKIGTTTDLRAARAGDGVHNLKVLLGTFACHLFFYLFMECWKCCFFMDLCICLGHGPGGWALNRRWLDVDIVDDGWLGGLATAHNDVHLLSSIPCVIFYGESFSLLRIFMFSKR